MEIKHFNNTATVFVGVIYLAKVIIDSFSYKDIKYVRDVTAEVLLYYVSSPIITNICLCNKC